MFLICIRLWQTSRHRYAPSGMIKDLQTFDISNLDPYEAMVYADFSRKMPKAEALQIIINSVEGDYSQLSPELAEIAESLKRYRTPYC